MRQTFSSIKSVYRWTTLYRKKQFSYTTTSNQLANAFTRIAFFCATLPEWNSISFKLSWRASSYIILLRLIQKERSVSPSHQFLSCMRSGRFCGFPIYPSSYSSSSSLSSIFLMCIHILFMLLLWRKETSTANCPENLQHQRRVHCGGATRSSFRSEKTAPSLTFWISTVADASQ